jgi:SAM-dependent methyltransferase
LDVGCGNGFITELVAERYDEVVGIDVEEQRLEDFRMHARGKSNFKIMLMSAAEIGFASESFSFITCFEVLEHAMDVDASIKDIVRVCKRGGIIVVSVPQAWFPFETHGMRLGKRIYSGKIPLLPYIRPLHRRYSLARVFSSAEMDRLFLCQGMQLLETNYASPQFERAAAQSGSWESRFVFLRHLLGGCERVPLLRALTGVSMLKAYRKGLRPDDGSQLG